jgi:hypothetical protein
MKQMARNLTGGWEGVLSGDHCLIHDRASVFGEEFRMILQAAGVESVRLPSMTWSNSWPLAENAQNSEISL